MEPRRALQGSLRKLAFFVPLLRGLMLHGQEGKRRERTHTAAQHHDPCNCKQWPLSSAQRSRTLSSRAVLSGMTERRNVVHIVATFQHGDILMQRLAVLQLCGVIISMETASSAELALAGASDP